jgi:dihydrofolate reductase
MKMIVATDNNNGIGKNNTIPWYISEDLRRFSKLTRGEGNNAIIMGRNTYESIGKALPGRFNIVMSRTMNTGDANINICRSKEDVINLCNNYNFDDIWVIGGAYIYDEFFKDITELYVTEILNDFDCDTFFIYDYQEAFNNCEIEIGDDRNSAYTFYYKRYTR